jgi:ribosome-binding factor A
VPVSSGSHRVQKVASLVREEVARLLVSEVEDPRLKHLVITQVELSRDLRYAKIFYELGEGTDAKEVSKGLGRANGFLRKRMGSNLAMKYVPELSFEADLHSTRLNRVLTVLEEVNLAKLSGSEQ